MFKISDHAERSRYNRLEIGGFHLCIQDFVRSSEVRLYVDYKKGSGAITIPKDPEKLEAALVTLATDARKLANFLDSMLDPFEFDFLERDEVTE